MPQMVAVVMVQVSWYQQSRYNRAFETAALTHAFGRLTYGWIRLGATSPLNEDGGHRMGAPALRTI